MVQPNAKYLQLSIFPAFGLVVLHLPTVKRQSADFELGFETLCFHSTLREAHDSFLCSIEFTFTPVPPVRTHGFNQFKKHPNNPELGETSNCEATLRCTSLETLGWIIQNYARLCS